MRILPLMFNEGLWGNGLQYKDKLLREESRNLTSPRPPPLAAPTKVTGHKKEQGDQAAERDQYPAQQSRRRPVVQRVEPVGNRAAHACRARVLYRQDLAGIGMPPTRNYAGNAGWDRREHSCGFDKIQHLLRGFLSTPPARRVRLTPHWTTRRRVTGWAKPALILGGAGAGSCGNPVAVIAACVSLGRANMIPVPVSRIRKSNPDNPATLCQSRNARTAGAPRFMAQCLCPRSPWPPCPNAG